MFHFELLLSRCCSKTPLSFPYSCHSVLCWMELVSDCKLGLKRIFAVLKGKKLFPGGTLPHTRENEPSETTHKSLSRKGSSAAVGASAGHRSNGYLPRSLGNKGSKRVAQREYIAESPKTEQNSVQRENGKQSGLNGHRVAGFSIIVEIQY